MVWAIQVSSDDTMFCEPFLALFTYSMSIICDLLISLTAFRGDFLISLTMLFRLWSLSLVLPLLLLMVISCSCVGGMELMGEEGEG